MSLRYAGANRGERDTLAAALDKAYQLPARGEHVGARAAEGPPIQREWDGQGRVPFGWSSYQGHRNGEDAVFLPDEPETQSKLARLTAQERALLAAARQVAEPAGTPVKERAR